jgi:Domain of unknown function (DUF5668)
MSDESPQEKGKDPALHASAIPQSSTLIAGLLIIAVGVVLLLDQEGIVSLSQILRYWPVILIVVGLAKLIRGRDSQGQVVGAGLVFFGLLFQFSSLGFRHFELSHIWPLIVIAGGVWVLWAPARTRGPSNAPPSILNRTMVLWKRATGDTTQGEINAVHVLGGGESRITSRNFRGGKLVAIFGGFKVDMSEAEMDGNEAVIDLVAFFGGGEFVIPRSWEVSVRGAGLFGGYGDETRHALADPGAPRKTLVIRGTWTFGGFNVKN